MAYAKWIFYAYSRDEGSKLTRLETWQRIEKGTGKRIEEYASIPRLREGLVYYWNMYQEIKAGCDSLTYVELSAYSQVSKFEFSQWEASLMFDLEMLRVQSG